MNRELVAHLAEVLVSHLQASCLRIEPAGSFRRRKAECGDLELVCIPRPGVPRPEFGQKHPFSTYLDQALARLEETGHLGHRIKDGEKYKQIDLRTEAFGLVYPSGFKLDLFIVRPETWGVQFAIRTGPADFSHKFVTQRKLGGWLPDRLKVEGGLLWERETNLALPTPEEQDFFTAIGLPWLEPWERREYLAQAESRKTTPQPSALLSERYPAPRYGRSDGAK